MGSYASRGLFFRRNDLAGLLALYLALGSMAPDSARDPEAILTSLLLLPSPDKNVLPVAWTLKHEVLFYVVFSLVTMREAFGIFMPDDVPLWVGILVVWFVYQSAAWPLHAARRASYQALGGLHHASVAALDGMLSLGIAAFIVWFAYNNMPEVREFLRTLPEMLDSMRPR